MREQKVILLLVVIAILLTIFLTAGVGYASATEDTLKFDDDIIASPEQCDFKVRFSGKPTYTGDGTADLKIIGNTRAIMNVKGLNSVGDSVTASFEITNKSRDIDAQLSKKVNNSNTEYFKVTAMLSESEVASKGGNAILKVTIKLIKTPINDVMTNVNVELKAKPIYNN